MNATRRTRSKTDVPFLRQPFVYSKKELSDESGITFKEATKTQQQFKDESDINVIVDRFLRTGQLPDSSLQASFVDLMSMPTDYHEALNFVLDAQGAFLQLPSNIRERFENSPGALLTFLQDQNNYEEAVNLGLVEKRQVAAEMPNPPPPEITLNGGAGEPST